MKKINSLFFVSVLIILFFINFFWIGTEEEKIELIEQLPNSFFKRFLILSFLGFVFICFLVLINYVVNRIVKKEEFNLKKNVLTRFIIVICVSLIGTLIFFFI
ncbi:hypothetical protein [Flavobacterium sp. I3-2]|uniref:hypothetical protein n=1 Tax=Flavobacterium sp. I3-2 TaxID=2748319 RepID=UPI0015A84959|nr:hypothetical protein [Flavobacterium sp. I3-2]